MFYTTSFAKNRLAFHAQFMGMIVREAEYDIGIPTKTAFESRAVDRSFNWGLAFFPKVFDGLRYGPHEFFIEEFKE